MIASDLLLVILVLHDMEGLIHVAQMIIPLEGVIQGQYHLVIGRIDDTRLDHAPTQDLLMAQGAGVEALMVAAAAASPLDILGDIIGVI